MAHSKDFFSGEEIVNKFITKPLEKLIQEKMRRYNINPQPNKNNVLQLDSISRIQEISCIVLWLRIIHRSIYIFFDDTFLTSIEELALVAAKVSENALYLFNFIKKYNEKESLFYNNGNPYIGIENIFCELKQRVFRKLGQISGRDPQDVERDLQEFNEVMSFFTNYITGNKPLNTQSGNVSAKIYYISVQTLMQTVRNKTLPMKMGTAELASRVQKVIMRMYDILSTSSNKHAKALINHSFVSSGILKEEKYSFLSAVKNIETQLNILCESVTNTIVKKENAGAIIHYTLFQYLMPLENFRPVISPHIAVFGTSFATFKYDEDSHNRKFYLNTIMENLPSKMSLNVLLKKIIENNLFTIKTLEQANYVSQLTCRILQSVLFQVFYTFACIQDTFPGFRHNDLHMDNVLIEYVPIPAETPNVVFHYDINSLKFDPNFGFEEYSEDFKTKERNNDKEQLSQRSGFFIKPLPAIHKIFEDMGTAFFSKEKLQEQQGFYLVRIIDFDLSSFSKPFSINNDSTLYTIKNETTREGFFQEKDLGMINRSSHQYDMFRLLTYVKITFENIHKRLFSKFHNNFYPNQNTIAIKNKLINLMDKWLLEDIESQLKSKVPYENLKQIKRIMKNGFIPPVVQDFIRKGQIKTRSIETEKYRRSVEIAYKNLTPLYCVMEHVYFRDLKVEKQSIFEYFTPKPNDNKYILDSYCFQTKNYKAYFNYIVARHKLQPKIKNNYFIQATKMWQEWYQGSNPISYFTQFYRKENTQSISKQHLDDANKKRKKMLLSEYLANKYKKTTLPNQHL